jgi:DNA helicase-2/ATP-dependent DNA helicase PcrA
VGKSVTKPLPDAKASADFKPNDPSDIQVGQTVEHQRFGLGVVEQLEGAGDNKKAVILFQEMGQKTLVLRFAKLMIRV